MDQKEDEPEIPFFHTDKKKSKAKKKRKKGEYNFGIFSFFLLISIVLGLFTFTPLYSLIIPHIPKHYQASIFQDLYQSVQLVKTRKVLKDPVKLQDTKPLPVLGFNSGVCFIFPEEGQNSKKKSLYDETLDDAKQNKPIAEIIAVNNKDGYKYALKETTVDETFDEQNFSILSICQKFGNDYPLLPESVKAVYVRPIKPFIPDRIIWATTSQPYELK